MEGSEKSLQISFLLFGKNYQTWGERTFVESSELKKVHIVFTAFWFKKSAMYSERT